MINRHFLRRFVRVGLFLLLLLAAAILAWGFSSRNLPDLKPWHVTELPSQFERADIEAMTGLEDYLAREARLFAELDDLVYGVVESAVITRQSNRESARENPIMARHQRMPTEEAGYTYAVVPTAIDRLLANEEESIYGRSENFVGR